MGPRLRGDDGVRGDNVPSISHTSAGSVIHSTGQAKNGAMASTETAPAANAAARLRHPRKLRTRSASASIDTSAGMGSLTDGRPQTSRAPAPSRAFSGWHEGGRGQARAPARLQLQSSSESFPVIGATKGEVRLADRSGLVVAFPLSTKAIAQSDSPHPSRR